jgi:hypothetical protein
VWGRCVGFNKRLRALGALSELGLNGWLARYPRRKVRPPPRRRPLPGGRPQRVLYPEATPRRPLDPSGLPYVRVSSFVRALCQGVQLREGPMCFNGA